jgi:short-subunit dehydrogenase
MSAKTDDMKNGVCLITGASSGIGRELARVCAQNGHDLVLVARREKELRELISEVGGGRAIVADLAKPQAANEIFKEIGAVDLLINNAGFAIQGEFANSDVQCQMDLLAVNMVALTHLTRLFLPAMIQRKRGRILNISSIAAFMPGPLTATYFASKAYVLSFSEAIRHELRGSGVTVTCLCPGPTKTGFDERAGLTGTKAFAGGVMDAADVARIGYAAMMAGRCTVVPGWRNRARCLPLPFVPRGILAHFARKYHERNT